MPRIPSAASCPRPGGWWRCVFPMGCASTSGVAEGDTVTPYYDPMIAKLIAHAGTREQALDRLADALDHTVVAGPRSNAGFLAALCRAPDFRTGTFDTGFIERHLAELGAAPQGLDRAAAAAGAQALLAREQARLAALQAPETPTSPWDAGDGFQLGGARRLQVPLIAEGENLTALVSYAPHGVDISIAGIAPAGDATVIADDDAVLVLCAGRQTRVTLRDAALEEGGGPEHSGLVRAPMHGKVLAVLVEQGTTVVRGQRLAIIEAMKMEHTLTAPIDGTVTEIAVSADAQVAEGAKLIAIAPASATLPE